MNAAGGEGLIALAAARAAARGLNLNEVSVVADKARENSECLFVIDTLWHVYRTGRILEEGPPFQDSFNKGMQVYQLAGKVVVQDTVIDFVCRN